MATALQFPTPLEFSFVAAEWPSWLRRFERFRIVSELNSKAEVVQINTLIYSMGDKAEELLDSLKLTEEEYKSYKLVSAKITAFFIPKTNVIFERSKFNQRAQKVGESAESFISELHFLASKCSYGTLKDELVRDRIVVGILDSKLSEVLQLDENLTLEKSVSKVMQAELIKGQQITVRQETNKEIAQVQKGKKQNFQTKQQYHRTEGLSTDPCNRCGNKNHFNNVCPAKNVKCNKCSKIGHFAKWCLSAQSFKQNNNRPGKPSPASRYDNSKVRNVDSLFLGGVQVDDCDPWVVEVSVGLVSSPIAFLVDSGADITCINENQYNSTMGKLVPVNKLITGPSGSSLEVIGKTNVELSFKSNSCFSDIYVVRNLSRALLGRPTLEPLNIVQRLASVSSSNPWVCKYPNVFQGLGKMPGIYKIKLLEDAEPYSVCTPRRVAIPLLTKVKNELTKMVNMDTIVPITDPTDWCAPMVVVPKENGDVRITCDFSKLNQAVRREKFEMPSVEDTLSQLSGAKIFSKLDANSGFYQCVLDEESAPLTTFITPFGRYMFNRIPMGITSAPEIYSRQMAQVLQGLKGVKNLMDDICIFGATQAEHDANLTAVLNRLQSSGVTLNLSKCNISVNSLSYLGYIVDANGVHADPTKVESIVKFPTPSSVTEVRRLLGMVNQLAKFLPMVADVSKPIRSLLNKDSSWYWGPPQVEAFQRIKKLLTSTEVLAHYDRDSPTRVCADSSSYGLGAVLLQKVEGNWRPVSYASRSLIDAETRYATIEKEALAICWACEKFCQYLIGLHFEILTDHKPLTSLLQHKRVDELPIRIQRFRIRLFRYSYVVNYVKGSEQLVADALSRGPVLRHVQKDLNLCMIVEEFATSSLQVLPISKVKLSLIVEKQLEDENLALVRKYVLDGWPVHVPSVLKSFKSVSSELTIVDNVLLKNARIVVPLSLRKNIIDCIHEGHQGIVKCLERARTTVWWHHMTSEVKDKVASCGVCNRQLKNRAEPLMPREFPSRPWEKIATDLFHFQNKNYLLVVDFYSRWIELVHLSSTTSIQVINSLKSIFARYGIPDSVLSDGGPQYTSLSFKQFSDSYGFTHIRSSPYFPQSNGEAERAVQTVKSLLRKADSSGQDPYLALLSYRTTPLRNGYSPSQLLMNRSLQSRLPAMPKHLEPSIPDPVNLQISEQEIRFKSKQYFDKHHGTRELPKLQSGQQVHIRREKRDYTVVRKHEAPRSYIVRDDRGRCHRRNRREMVTVSFPNDREEYHSAESESSADFKSVCSETPEEIESEVVNDEPPIATQEATAPPPDEEPRRSSRSTKGKLPLRYRD